MHFFYNNQNPINIKKWRKTACALKTKSRLDGNIVVTSGINDRKVGIMKTLGFN